MKHFVNILLFLTCTSLSTCKKEPPIAPQQPYYTSPKSVLDTLWTSPLTGFSINPMLNSNGDVLMSDMFNNTGKGEIIKLFDQNTGALKWEWYDYFTPAEGFKDIAHLQINDILILSDQNYNYALNMLTGQTVWKTRMDSVNAYNNLFQDEDGYIYKGFFSKTLKGTVYVFRTLYNTGNWELVCTYTDNSMAFRRFEITAIGITKNAKSEKVVAFSIYTLGSNNQNPKALIVGYNMENKSFDWEKDYGNFLGEFSVFMYCNYNGLVYSFANYGATYYLLAINVNDGKIEWQQVLPNFGVGLYFYKTNLIVTSNDQSPAISFNQTTGAIQWKQTFNALTTEQKSMFGFSFYDSKVFKNYILSTQCDRLLALNADNGNIVYYENVALPEGCLQHGLAIDEQKGVFYVEDRLRAICYKLPTVLK